MGIGPLYEMIPAANGSAGVRWNWALIFTAGSAALALAVMVFAGQKLFLDPVPLFIGDTPLLAAEYIQAVTALYISAADTAINLALAIIVAASFAIVKYGLGPRFKRVLSMLFVSLTAAMFTVFAAQKAKMGLLIQMQYARVDLERLEGILSALYLGLFLEAAFALMAISMIWWDAHHADEGQHGADGGSASDGGAGGGDAVAGGGGDGPGPEHGVVGTGTGAAADPAVAAGDERQPG
ncbi:MAG: hypothetical protein AB7O49_09160 [Sphingomonadales bacterium]